MLIKHHGFLDIVRTVLDIVSCVDLHVSVTVPYSYEHIRAFLQIMLTGIILWFECFAFIYVCETL
jgi:hypothetical protein